MEVSYNKVLNQLPKYDISEPKWRLDFYESLDKRLKKQINYLKKTSVLCQVKKAQFTTIIYFHGKTG